ncbi:MAG: U32 family peptidase [Lachnospiraceae bacterium]|nr:U32 family peptidase [Lachnospiraceae bacterium]
MTRETTGFISKPHRPELLMPGGSLELLKTAVNYGADAVYIGDESMSLRAAARNFSVSEIREGVEYAHERGKKVYIAANIFAHNEDLPKAMKLFLQLKSIMPDGLIISDPGVFNLARSLVPEIPVHISTQANNTNFSTYDFWYKMGVRRVVSARELTLSEIRQIRENIPDDMEIESFVHGAMCISYSGRCLISSFLTGRDANRGACTHPCRWSYSLMEESRPGEYMPVFEDGRGTYLYHSRDLCMIEHIPELISAGIDSFKIEGRMKNALYLAIVTAAYRRAIDDYLESPEKYEESRPEYLSEILKTGNRTFCTGFYFGNPGAEAQVYENSKNHTEYIYIGTVFTEKGRPYFIQKNKFSVGDEIEVLRPFSAPVRARVISLETEEGEPVMSAPHASQRLYPTLDIGLEDYDVMRMPQKQI